MLTNEVLELLRTKDKRITMAKLEIIKFFIANKDYISVNELRDKLNTKPDMSTIYRNLESFCEIGFLEKMQKDDRRWYKLKEDYTTHDHKIKCEICGKEKILDFCPIVITENNVNGFKITGHKFELLGICNECQKNM